MGRRPTLNHHISVVTVTFNNQCELEQYWSAKTLRSFEWIVVDNASTDDSVSVARSLGATGIKLKANVGFAKANNIGMRAAVGEHLYFVNPDVKILERDFDSLGTMIDTYGALVAPRLKNIEGSLQPNARGIPTLFSKVVSLFTKNGNSGCHDPNTAIDKSTTYWLTGAVVGSKRQIWHELGGWNEKYFLYFEDIDLCLRAMKSKIPLMLLEDVKWIHEWKRNSNNFSLFHIIQHFRSATVFYAEYPSLLLPKALSRKILTNNGIVPMVPEEGK